MWNAIKSFFKSVGNFFSSLFGKKQIPQPVAIEPKTVETLPRNVWSEWHRERKIIEKTSPSLDLVVLEARVSRAEANQERAKLHGQFLMGEMSNSIWQSRRQELIREDLRLTRKIETIDNMKIVPA